MFTRNNLRKNLLRVKQNIDQNLGRAEKSEVLSEDQQENEKRVDVVKHAVQNIVKKAGAVLQATGTDYDKRLKKLPETGLGLAMVEAAQGLGPETLMGSACQICGDCQIDLAREQVTYETTVEQEFIAPLQTVIDVDIPSIIKFRKALNKSTLDMDSAKTRFNQAVRQSSVPGANMANAAAKADVIKEEMEEAQQKVENIRDSLSIELCNFAAKESEHSTKLLALLEAQASYHKKALEIIESCIPQMREAIRNSPAKPCYGMPLEEHLRIMCRDIAVVLEACVVTLLETGMEEEGLFRIAGSAIKLKKLKASFDANAVDMAEFSTDPHTVAGALKQYLRELPEPLLSYALFDDFMQAVNLPQDQRLQALWTVINKLPKANYNNFRYLIKFLAKLAERSDVNKMKPSNIAIVIGPNLLWSEESNAPNMLTTGTLSAIIEACVTHADWFFPGEIDFLNVGYYDEDHDGQGSYHGDQTQNNLESLQVQVTPSVSVSQPSQPSPAASPAPSSHSSTGSLPQPSESPDSSTLSRRQTRKPAPPPPSERPFTVMVTAATGPNKAGNSVEGNQSRQAPLASPESPINEQPASPQLSERFSRSFHGQLQPSHRPSVPPPDRPGQPPPERPRIPPTLTPGTGRGHQRSASTGAMQISAGNPGIAGNLHMAGVPNAEK